MQPPSDGSTHEVGVRPCLIGTLIVTLVSQVSWAQPHKLKALKEYTIHCPSCPFLVRSVALCQQFAEIVQHGFNESRTVLSEWRFEMLPQECW